MRDLRPSLGEAENIKIITAFKNLNGIQDFNGFTQ
jgi:hypothetical protein